MMHKSPSKKQSFLPDELDPQSSQLRTSPAGPLWPSSVTKSSAPRPPFPGAHGGPPMSPAAFSGTAPTSTSLSVVEPKAQKPIQSASKKSDSLPFSSSFRQQGRPGLRACSREKHGRLGGNGPASGAWDGVEGHSRKEENTAGKGSAVADLSLTEPFGHTSASDEERDRKAMEKQKYITIDPWSSRGTFGNNNFPGTSSRVGENPAANAFVRTSTLPTERSSAVPAAPVLSAWGSGKNETLMASRALTFDQRGSAKTEIAGGCWRGYGSGGTGATASDGECTYSARPSRDSCSTAASYQLYGPRRSDEGAGKSWGRLRLSDGSEYASTYFGKSWSGSTPSSADPVEAARGGARVHSSSVGIGGETVYRFSKAPPLASSYFRTESSGCTPVPPVFPSVQYLPQAPAEVITAPRDVHGPLPPTSQSQAPAPRFSSPGTQANPAPLSNTVQGLCRGSSRVLLSGDAMPLHTEPVITPEHSTSSVCPSSLSARQSHQDWTSSFIQNISSEASHVLSGSDSRVRAASCSSSLSLSAVSSSTGKGFFQVANPAKEVASSARTQHLLPPLPPPCHFSSSLSSGLSTGDPRRRLATPPVPPRVDGGLVAVGSIPGDGSLYASSARAPRASRRQTGGEATPHPRRSSLPAHALSNAAPYTAPDVSGGPPAVLASSFCSSTYKLLPPFSEAKAHELQQHQEVVSSGFVPLQLSEELEGRQRFPEKTAHPRRGFSAPREVPSTRAAVSGHESGNGTSARSPPALPRCVTCSTPPVEVPSFPVTQPASRSPLSGEGGTVDPSFSSCMPRGEGNKAESMVVRRRKSVQAVSHQRSWSLGGTNQTNRGALRGGAVERGDERPGSIKGEQVFAYVPSDSKRGQIASQDDMTNPVSYETIRIADGRARRRSENLRSHLQQHAKSTAGESLQAREREMSSSGSRSEAGDDLELDATVVARQAVSNAWRGGERSLHRRRRPESRAHCESPSSSSTSSRHLSTKRQPLAAPPPQKAPTSDVEQASALQVFLEEAAAAIGLMCGGSQAGRQKRKTRKVEKAADRRPQHDQIPEHSGVFGSYENLTSLSGGVPGVSYEARPRPTHDPPPASVSSITKTRRLPASPIAPIDYTCVSVDPSKDCRPAVALSPIRSPPNVPLVSCEIFAAPRPTTTTSSTISTTGQVNGRRRGGGGGGGGSGKSFPSSHHSPPEAPTSPMPHTSVPRASSTSPKLGRDLGRLSRAGSSSSDGLPSASLSERGGGGSPESSASQAPDCPPPPPPSEEQDVSTSTDKNASVLSAATFGGGKSVLTTEGRGALSNLESQKDEMEKRGRQGGGDGEGYARLDGSVVPLGREEPPTVHLLCGVTGRRMKFSAASGGAAGLPSGVSSQFSPLSNSLGPFGVSCLEVNGGSNCTGGGGSISSLLLEKASSRTMTRKRLLSRPLQLIHVNRWDGREVLTVDEQARKFLSELGAQHIAVISLCGATQTGKSGFANLLLDDPQMLSSAGFAVGSPPGSVGGAFSGNLSSCLFSSFANGNGGLRKTAGGGGGRGSAGYLEDGGHEAEDQMMGVTTQAGLRFEQRVLRDGCTEGVWIQAVSLSGGVADSNGNGRGGGGEGRDDFVYLILDFEGVGCTRKTVEHDQRLFTLAMLISHYLVYTTRGVLDADAISGMASVSMWTQRLLRCGGGPPNGGGSASPSLVDDGGSRLSPANGSTVPRASSGGPRVPSGWRAPSLLWLLQDFNYTLADENDNPLTESDYLEAVLATASHVSPCCLPESRPPSSSLASSNRLSSSATSLASATFHRTCMELNQPQIRVQRQQLAELFDERTCVGLPHPLGLVPSDAGTGGGPRGGGGGAGGAGSDGEYPSDPHQNSHDGMSSHLGRPSTRKRDQGGLLSSVVHPGFGGEDPPSQSLRDHSREDERRDRRVRRTSSSQFSFFDASVPPSAQEPSSHPPSHGTPQLLRAVETTPVIEFHSVYRRRLHQVKATIFKECRLRAAEGVAITGTGFVKILQKIIDGINGGEVPESRSVVGVVQREECRKWKENCEQTFMHDLRETFQSRLPMSNRELQDGALALQKRALSHFKMHVIGDDDVVRGYKQQLKDRLRKITDRAIEENERHGEWKARSRLRTLTENLQIERKLKEKLYSSMAQVNEDVETLKKEFNSDCRGGPAHVYQRILNEQIDEFLAKGSAAVCEVLLDQSREAERTVQELQQRAQEAEQTMEKTLQLEQQLQTRDYYNYRRRRGRGWGPAHGEKQDDRDARLRHETSCETEELRRELEEQRATNQRLNTMVRSRTGHHGTTTEDDDDLDSRLNGLQLGRHRTSRSRIGVHDQNRCFGQKRCTVM